MPGHQAKESGSMETRSPAGPTCETLLEGNRIDQGANGTNAVARLCFRPLQPGRKLSPVLSKHGVLL